MTTTILNQTTDTDVSLTLESINLADWSIVDQVVKDNGARETTYQFIGSDPKALQTVRVGFYPRNGRLSYSIRLNGFVSNDEYDEPAYREVSGVIALDLPADITRPASSALAILLQNLFGFFIPTATAGVADVDHLDKLQLGITNFS